MRGSPRMTSPVLTPADAAQSRVGHRGPSPSSSGSRAVDRETRRFIREELLTNILVEAGAGSGKTQMLAERMAAGVAAGVYKIEQMAAVTFTRKAASELRGRFHLALEKLLPDNTRDVRVPPSHERTANRKGLGDGGQAEEAARVH